MTLEEYARAAQDTPFEWGVNDCAMWAAKWWEMNRGEALKLPPYKTEAEANAKIEQAGGLVRLIESQIGPSFQSGRPSNGDIMVINLKSGEMTTLSLGNDYAVARTEKGIRLFYCRDNLIKGFWPIQ